TLSLQDGEFTQTLPLSFATALAPLTFEGAASATVTATANLNATFGINLAGLQTVLTGNKPAPANGQLGADAHFTLAVAGANPVSVALTAASSQNNQNLADLVNDLNSVLASAGLSRFVVA